MKLFPLLLSLPLILLFSEGYGQNPAPVIDMHLHADLPPGEVHAGEGGPCRPEPCEMKGSATASHQETLEQTLAIMDRNNIVKAFLSGLDPEVMKKWVEAAPDRFIVSPFIFKPGMPGPEELKKAYEANQFQGMGEIATQLAGVAPNDPALEPYFALAEERDLPVLIHTEGIGPYLPTFRTSAGKPLLLEDVLIKHPDLRIFVENTGYPFLDDMVALMSQYPQLYGDLSTITWVIPRTAFHDYLKALMRAGLGKRLMFGSDQMRWPEMIEAGLDAIKSADFLTEEEKRDILYNNAAAFLRLEQPN